MAGRTVDDTLLAASGPYAGSSGLTGALAALPQSIGGLSDTLTGLTQSFGRLISVSQSEAEAVAANTQALGQNTSSHSGGSIAGLVGQAASSLLGGFGFSPLISGLMGLFGGGSPSQPPPLVPFQLPPSISFQSANILGPGGLPGADYSQSGLPRAISASSQTPSAATAPGANITVNIQTMDSRSFLDHSSDIASAVRDAMLSMHSLNDVVGDL